MIAYKETDECSFKNKLESETVCSKEVVKGSKNSIVFVLIMIWEAGRQQWGGNTEEARGLLYIRIIFVKPLNALCLKKTILLNKI